MIWTAARLPLLDPQFVVWIKITCLELNAAMNERAAAAAGSAGVNSMLVFREADFNTWTADQRYYLALASHSLRHVVKLEHLFEQIREALQPDGRFLINDMIGRNGHLHWPEALALVQLVWATTPRRYRYNRQLSRFEERSGARTDRGRCPCLCGTRPLVQSTSQSSLTAVCDVRTHSAFRTYLECDGLVLCSLDRSPYSEGLRWPLMATTGGDDRDALIGAIQVV
jgi:SAM-dependent methyltransferase